MSITSTTIATIEECAQASYAGSMDFGSVVAKLMAAGVESYYADYRNAEIRYYLPSDEVHVIRVPKTDDAIAATFDAPGVQQAVRGAQRGEVKYPEFLRLTKTAGCIGYFVWIAGRHVQYLGRRGESHVEHFPSR